MYTVGVNLPILFERINFMRGAYMGRGAAGPKPQQRYQYWILPSTDRSRKEFSTMPLLQLTG